MAWWESMQKEQLGQVAKDKQAQKDLLTVKQAKQLQPDIRSFQPTVHPWMLLFVDARNTLKRPFADLIRSNRCREHTRTDLSAALKKRLENQAPQLSAPAQSRVSGDLEGMQQPKLPKIAAVSTNDHAQSGSTIDKFKVIEVSFFSSTYLSVLHLVTLYAPAHSCVHESGCPSPDASI